MQQIKVEALNFSDLHVCIKQLSTALLIFTGGADYESFSESFQFHPLAAINEQRVCHNLTIFNDSLLEDQESLTITMQVNHPGVSIHIQRTTVIIVDDDEVTLSFRSSSATAQDVRIVSEDVEYVKVCVDLDGSTEKAIEYSVIAQPGTAQGRVGRL